MGFQPTDSAAVAGMPHDGDEAEMLARAARAADKAAQEARSKKYHIAIKDGGNVTKPSEWADLPDSAFGDPVNYGYPMKDKAHADNAAARWGDESNREQYTPAEQKIIGDRIEARQKSFGEEKKKDDGKRAASVASVPGAELSGTLYAPFVRRDDAKWEVEGVLTSEDIDTYGTIFDYESAKRAVAEWAGNVREQHDPTKAVGRRVEYECDDDNKIVKLRVRVSKGAPDTWAKVQDGTLSGFSIGAYNARRETRSVNGRAIPVYKDYQYGEVSLVDAPSNPAAARSGLTICRAAGGGLEWNDAVLDTFDTPATLAETTALPADVVAAHDERAVASVPSDAFIVAPTPVSLDALESAVGPLSEEQRTAVAAATAVIQGGSSLTTATANPAAAVTHVEPALTRASIDLASGAAFQGNDLSGQAANRAESSGDAVDDGSDPERPVGKAMLDETGHAHDAHSHPHGSDYGGMHIHAHEHTHQDGTTHAHPHMHNHAHHDHYGDMSHAHPHTHVHDHSHDFRSAAPDLSKVTEPYPGGVGESAKGIIAPAGSSDSATTAVSGETEHRASHGAFTGKHSHPHPAFGSQGDDESHEHEHSHDGDAQHDHAHESSNEGEGERSAAGGEVTAVIAGEHAPAQPETLATPDAPAVTGAPASLAPLETAERAGQRISSDTRAALHQAALQILRTCDCPTCQDAISLYDPDDDGDDDLDGPAGGDDPDEDGPLPNRAMVASLTRSVARANRLQRVQLTRATRQAVASEVQAQLAPMQGLIQQMRGIAARLTTVPSVPSVNGSDNGSSQPDGGDASVKPQLDEVRASLEAVRGLVEQIAAQPAPGGPILRAVDKTLGQYAPTHALDASVAPTTPGDLSPEQLAAAIRQLQRAGALSDQGSQVNAAAAILQQQMTRGR
jgi:hypothetical protein